MGRGCVMGRGWFDWGLASRACVRAWAKRWVPARSRRGCGYSAVVKGMGGGGRRMGNLWASATSRGKLGHISVRPLTVESVAGGFRAPWAHCHPKSVPLVGPEDGDSQGSKSVSFGYLLENQLPPAGSESCHLNQTQNNTLELGTAGRVCYPIV